MALSCLAACGRATPCGVGVKLVLSAPILLEGCWNGTVTTLSSSAARSSAAPSPTICARKDFPARSRSSRRDPQFTHAATTLSLRLDPPAILHPGKYPAVDIHARPVPPAEGRIRRGRRYRLSRDRLSDPRRRGGLPILKSQPRGADGRGRRHRARGCAGAGAAISLAVRRGHRRRRARAAAAKAGSTRMRC